LSESAPRSLLAPQGRMPAVPAVALALLLHVIIFAAALVLPRLFDRAPPLRKPIIAHMVALGVRIGHRVTEPRKHMGRAIHGVRARRTLLNEPGVAKAEHQWLSEPSRGAPRKP